MTEQAFIVALAGAVAGIFFGYKLSPVVGLLLMGGAFLGAYNANCAVVGHCDIWAWTLAVVYVVNVLLLGRMAMKKRA